MNIQKTDRSQDGALLKVLAVGAALGAAAVALHDKDTQKKVKTKINEMKKWADQASAKLDTSINTMKKDSKSSVDAFEEGAVSTAKKLRVDEVDGE